MDLIGLVIIGPWEEKRTTAGLGFEELTNYHNKRTSQKNPKSKGPLQNPESRNSSKQGKSSRQSTTSKDTQRVRSLCSARVLAAFRTPNVDRDTSMTVISPVILGFLKVKFKIPVAYAPLLFLEGKWMIWRGNRKKKHKTPQKPQDETRNETETETAQEREGEEREEKPQQIERLKGKSIRVFHLIVFLHRVGFRPGPRVSPLVCLYRERIPRRRENFPMWSVIRDLWFVKSIILGGGQGKGLDLNFWPVLYMGRAWTNTY